MNDIEGLAEARGKSKTVIANGKTNLPWEKIYPIVKKLLSPKVNFIIKHSGFYVDNIYFTEKKGGKMLETKTNPRVHSLQSIIHKRNISIKLGAAEWSAFHTYSFSNITERTNRLTFAFFPWV